jgi:hypothetical protein
LRKCAIRLGLQYVEKTDGIALITNRQGKELFVSLRKGLYRFKGKMNSVPNLVHPAMVGTAYGLYEVSEAAGNIGGNWLVGFIRDRTGTYVYDLYLFTGMGCIAAILSLILSTSDRVKGGVLNQPTHTAQPHTPIRSEVVTAHALTGGSSKPYHDAHDAAALPEGAEQHHPHHADQRHTANKADDHLHLHLPQTESRRDR